MNTPAALPVLTLSRFDVFDAYWTSVEGFDGWAHYQIEHPDGQLDFMRQPFVRGPHRYDREGRPIWGWDGDAEHPTLTPSYVSTLSRTDRPRARVHLYLTRGRVILLADSTVTLGGAP